mmetsp:Transcript_18590/g.60606  ORF Transcript_18590/g.60606 Transcript_18590/m.60606 type:complete len:233 (-) Transcript_18590:327-1025(-)
MDGTKCEWRVGSGLFVIRYVAVMPLSCLSTSTHLSPTEAAMRLEAAGMHRPNPSAPSSIAASAPFTTPAVFVPPAFVHVPVRCARVRDSNRVRHARERRRERGGGGVQVLPFHEQARAWPRRAPLTPPIQPAVQGARRTVRIPCAGAHRGFLRHQCGGPHDGLPAGGRSLPRLFMQKFRHSHVHARISVVRRVQPRRSGAPTRRRGGVRGVGAEHAQSALAARGRRPSAARA